VNIEPTNITVRDLAAGYIDNSEAGVVGYGGKLDIRPPYQREFIYKDAQRDAVIDTVTKNYPLNVMYWSVRGDGGYEVIDGQQRTISICQYVAGDFAFKGRYFHNLQADEQNQILDYGLMIYQCSGADSERLEWFKTINIAGEELTVQELRNAVYHGPWVSDAKRHFSKSGSPAYGLASAYMSGTPIRQDYLETAIKWINDGAVDAYMAEHAHDPTANALWLYFRSVIDWVKLTFPKYRSPMKGVAWGPLYNRFGEAKLDPAELETRIAALMADDDVVRKKGIYTYILSGDEKYLNIRAFTPAQRRSAYERQERVCAVCGKEFSFEEMEADHITPWRSGGKTVPENCRMLCLEDNRRKGAI
jgi:HNH endonuclease/Protein of unknown function DUF262